MNPERLVEVLQKWMVMGEMHEVAPHPSGDPARLWALEEETRAVVARWVAEHPVVVEPDPSHGAKPRGDAA